MFMTVCKLVNMYIHVCTMFRHLCTNLPTLVQVVRIPDVKIQYSARLQELTYLGLTMPPRMYYIATLRTRGLQRSSVQTMRAFSVSISNVNLSFCT